MGPDKHLTLKPNLKKNSCLKIENLSSDILDAAKKIIVNKQKSKADANGNTEELEAKIDQLSSDNKQLRQKMSGLEQKPDEKHKIGFTVDKVVNLYLFFYLFSFMPLTSTIFKEMLL